MVHKITNYLHTLFSLVSIQMKNKSSVSFKNNKIGAIIRIVIYLILFAGLTTGIYFLFKLFQDDSIFGILVLPIYFFNFVFISIFVIITITTIFRFKNELYLAPDNQILLMLPTSKNQLFISKIIVSYLLDFFRNLIFVCPIFIAYGILNNFVPSYYPWLLFTLIFVLMVPVAIASLLSIFIFNIQIWLKKRYVFKNILIILIIITLFISLIVLCTFIPKELRIDERWETVILPQLKNFVLGFEKVFYPFQFLSMLMLGYTSSLKSPYRLPTISSNTGFIFLGIFAFFIVCILLNYFFLKRFFISTISRGHEHSKVTNDVIYKHNIHHAFYMGIYAYKNNKLLNENEYEILLNELYEKEPSLFNKNHVYIEDYLLMFRKHFKDIEFKTDLIIDFTKMCFTKICHKKYNHLVIVKKVKNNNLLCYDPYEFEKKNRKHSGVFALTKKNVIHDVRNSYDLFINAITLFVPSVAIFAANTIFSSLRLTLLGGQLVFSLTLFAILLMFTFYTSTASSLYSKSQKNAYVLNSSPYSKIVNVFTSLMHLFIIGFLSIILLIINYSYTTPLTDINMGCFFIALVAIFSLLLVVNASIDLFSLKRHNFTAATSDKAGEQNELYALIVSLFIVTIFSGLAFLLFRFYKDNASLYLMLISLFVLIIYCSTVLIIKLIKKKRREAR